MKEQALETPSYSSFFDPTGGHRFVCEAGESVSSLTSPTANTCVCRCRVADRLKTSFGPPLAAGCSLKDTKGEPRRKGMKQREPSPSFNEQPFLGKGKDVDLGL